MKTQEEKTWKEEGIKTRQRKLEKKIRYMLRKKTQLQEGTNKN